MSRAKSYFYKCVFNDMAHALILRKDVDEDWLGMTWQKCKWKMRKKTVFTRPAASDMVNFAKRVMDPTHLLFINMQTI